MKKYRLLSLLCSVCLMLSVCPFGFSVSAAEFTGDYSKCDIEVKNYLKTIDEDTAFYVWASHDGTNMMSPDDMKYEILWRANDALEAGKDCPYDEIHELMQSPVYPSMEADVMQILEEVFSTPDETLSKRGKYIYLEYLLGKYFYDNAYGKSGEIVAESLGELKKCVVECPPQTSVMLLHVTASELSAISESPHITSFYSPSDESYFAPRDDEENLRWKANDEYTLKTLAEVKEDDILSVRVSFTTVDGYEFDRVLNSVFSHVEREMNNYRRPFPREDVRYLFEKAGYGEYADRGVAKIEEWLDTKPDLREYYEIHKIKQKIKNDMFVTLQQHADDEVLRDWGLKKEQETNFDAIFNCYISLNVTLSELKTIAKDVRVGEIWLREVNPPMWNDGKIFDFDTYANDELMSVNCLCFADGETLPGIGCDHYQNKTMTVFRWRGESERMADFENNVTSIPDCFRPDKESFLTERVLFTDGVPNLGDYLFFFNRTVKEVYIPDSVTEIGEHTFPTLSDVKIYCSSGSYAAEYALAHKLECHMMDTGSICRQSVLRGDANGDGQRNMKDVLALRKFIAENAGEYVDILGDTGADVNGDSVINMKDVLMLRRYIAENA